MGRFSPPLQGSFLQKLSWKVSFFSFHLFPVNSLFMLESSTFHFVPCEHSFWRFNFFLHLFHLNTLFWRLFHRSILFSSWRFYSFLLHNCNTIAWILANYPANTGPHEGFYLFSFIAHMLHPFKGFNLQARFLSITEPISNAKDLLALRGRVYYPHWG